MIGKRTKKLGFNKGKNREAGRTPRPAVARNPPPMADARTHRVRTRGAAKRAAIEEGR